MTDYEKEWGRKNGLKKTSLRTIGYKGKTRIVYKANDGSLYYADGGHWNGTFEEYCFDLDGKTTATVEIRGKKTVEKEFKLSDDFNDIIRWDKGIENRLHDCVTVEGQGITYTYSF